LGAHDAKFIKVMLQYNMLFTFLGPARRNRQIAYLQNQNEITIRKVSNELTAQLESLMLILNGATIWLEDREQRGNFLSRRLRYMHENYSLGLIFSRSNYSKPFL